MPTAINRADIRSFLSEMQRDIDNGAIKNEANIETRVAVIKDKDRDDWAAAGLPRDMNPARLLTILGYEEKDMERQRSIKVGVGGHTIIPDFIISNSGKGAYVLDVKAPNVNLNTATGQIFDYLFQTNIAIGILFNGKEMDIYANTRLTKRTSSDDGNPLPLRVIRASGTAQLTEAWCRFLKPVHNESKQKRTDWSISA